MKIIRGYWKVEIDAKYFDKSEIEDFDIEHISEMVKKGYREGELIKEREV